ncbi:MAG: hypothetical protein HY748_07515 [Elusimicrobia bacterium]|nr:hypothetical protein [Elusimicrobiota bacterium]
MLRRLPHFAELRWVFEAAVPRPNVPYYTLVSEVIQRRINAALSGELSAEDALKSAEDEIRDIVRRYEG